MTLFIPDVAAGRFFLVVLIFFPVLSSLQKPKIAVSHNEKDVIIICEIPGPAGNDTTCNLYVGDQSHRILKTKIGNKKSSRSNLWFCLFTVTEEDLIRHLQSVGSQEVSCDYRVSSGPNSLSPRSDGYKMKNLLGDRMISDPTIKQTSSTAAGSTVSTVSTVSTHKASVRPTSNLLTYAALIPKTPLRPTTSSTSSLTPMATTSGSTVSSHLTSKISVRPITSSTTASSTLATSSVPAEENEQSTGNGNSGIYHMYCSVPDQPATSAQTVGL